SASCEDALEKGQLLPAIEPYLARVNDVLRVTLRCRLEAIQESYRPTNNARGTDAASRPTPSELTDPVNAVTVDAATPLAGHHLAAEGWGQQSPERVPTIEGEVDLNTSMAGPSSTDINARTLGYFPQGEGDTASTVIRQGDQDDGPKSPDNRPTSKTDF